MDYTVRYSDRRTVALQITRDGEVLVRAPFGFPEEKIETFTREKAAWIARHREKALSRPRDPESPETVRRLYALAQERLPGLTAHWAERMGLSCAGVRITGARYRLGSCNTKKHICYSYRLMEYPDAVIEYVVVHELAHLCEMNHSPRFYAIVEKYLPDYRERRKRITAGGGR